MKRLMIFHSDAGRAIAEYLLPFQIGHIIGRFASEEVDSGSLSCCVPVELVDWPLWVASSVPRLLPQRPSVGDGSAIASSNSDLGALALWP